MLSLCSLCNSRTYVARRCYRLEALRKIDVDGVEDWSHIYDKSPVVISGLASKWPAVANSSNRSWQDLTSLKKRIDSSTTVSVEMGRSYMDTDVKKVPIPFQQFIELLHSEETDPNLLDSIPKLYLAQHDISSIPSLMTDIEVPPLCKTGKGHLYSIKLWLNGVKGSFSPCHYDPFHNILVQVYGCKKVQLFCPSEADKLYPAYGTVQKNTSQVDLDQIDHQKFPLLEHLVGFEAALNSGDGLYIPYKWWHYCKSDGKSCSVNFWWL